MLKNYYLFCCLSELSNLVKTDAVKKDIYIMLRSKVLKIKYLMLLT